MPDSRFLQIHTLTSFSGVLLNRDETGAAKRMPYGGAVRTRISSQCLKRHWRTAADEWSLEGEAEKSLRTRHIFEKELQAAIKLETNAPDEIVCSVGKSITMMIYYKLSETDKKDNKNPEKKEKLKTRRQKGRDDESVRGRQTMLFGRHEIEALQKLSIEIVNEAVAAGDNAIEASVRADNRIMDQEINLSSLAKQAVALKAGLIAALFGRMVTSDPAANTDAAIHVAHAFTVHREESEGDYFTVVDDLSVAEGETGSGGIFDTEITSGLFYSYVVIDVPLLISNLTGVEAAAAFAESMDRALPARIVEHLVHLIATVSPGAKKGSTAPYAYASLMMIEAGSRQPRSLAAAFRDPVMVGHGISPDEAAIQAMAAQLDRFDKAYDPHEARRLMNATTANAAALGEANSLIALATWAAQTVRDGKA
jgi:CRISPR system Cascade subunit CasC